MNALRRRFQVVGVALLFIFCATALAGSVKVLAAAPSPSDYRVPVIGTYKISNMDSDTGCEHEGHLRMMDINGTGGTDSDWGDPVYASGSGGISVGTDPNYGNYVLLDSNGVTFRYAHLSKVYVEDGDSVLTGALLGLMGKTGMRDFEEPHYAHVHWEGWYTSDGTPFNIYAIPGVDANHTPCTDDLLDTVTGGPIPGNPYNSCSEYEAAFLDESHIALFDNTNCRGNVLRLFDDENRRPTFYLNASAHYNDRTRTIYVSEGMSVVVGAHIDDDPDKLQRCYESSQEDLDTQRYNSLNSQGFSPWIGYNPTASEHATNPDGYDMISYVGVSNAVECWDATAVGSYIIHTGGGGGQGSDPYPSWLLEFSKAEVPPFEVRLHLRVAAPAGVYDAHRVLVDGNVIYETSAGEFFYTWNTYGWSDGSHSMTIQYRVLADGGNWANAESYSEQYYLSPNRGPFAPCDGGPGAILNSGSECIRVLSNVSDLATIGWGDRNMTVTASGYDVLAYDSCCYQGPARLIRNGQIVSVGGNVSSIELRQPLPGPYVPDTPLGLNASTIKYLPMDEGSGSTTVSTDGSFVGTLFGGASFVPGRFGSAIYIPNPPDGTGVTFPAIDFGRPFTVELFVKMVTVGGDQRIMTQIGGSHNVGSNKWLIGSVGERFRVWLCHVYGCHEAYSLEGISPGRWYYIMLTYDGDKTGKFYLDSVLQATINMDFVMSPGATTFDIGQGDRIYICNCVVDEVRISSGVLEPLGPQVPTVTPVPTVVPTNTVTPTPLNTPTSTLTPLPSPTRTPTQLVASPTKTSTFTRTPTRTRTPSRTPTVAGPSPTRTPTKTRTPTRTPTSTRTLNPTRTSTATLIPTITSGVTTPYKGFYFSIPWDEVINGVEVMYNDVAYYDADTGTVSIIFSGDDLWNSESVDAISKISEMEYILSFDGDEDGIAGMSTIVRDEDLVLCNPVTVSCQMYFDGSDVGLGGVFLNVMGVDYRLDGKLLLTVYNSFFVPSIPGDDYDVYLFTPTSLGVNTAGTLSLYLDGSDIGIDEDITGIWYDDSNNSMCLSFERDLETPSVVVSQGDVICFFIQTYGQQTTGVFDNKLYFAYSVFGENEELGAIEFVPR